MVVFLAKVIETKNLPNWAVVCEFTVKLIDIFCFEVKTISGLTMILVWLKVRPQTAVPIAALIVAKVESNTSTQIYVNS